MCLLVLCSFLTRNVVLKEDESCLGAIYTFSTIHSVTCTPFLLHSRENQEHILNVKLMSFDSILRA